MAQRDGRDFPNLQQLVGTEELLAWLPDGTAGNVLLSLLHTWLRKQDGVGLSPDQEAAFNRLIAERQAVTSLPDDAPPGAVFDLTATDGDNAPGVYVRTPGGAGPKSDTFTAYVTFGPRAGGGALYDRAMGVGTAHGLPDEIERIEIDPAGTVIGRVETDVSIPGGAGTLDWELTGVGWTYSITAELRTQTPFSANVDPYYVVRGSIEPVSGGRTLKIVQTDAEAQADYFTPQTAPGWLRIAGIGRQGATGWTAVPTVDANGLLSWQWVQSEDQPAVPAARSLKGPKGDKGDPGASGSDADGAADWAGRTSGNKLLLAVSDEGAEDVTVWSVPLSAGGGGGLTETQVLALFSAVARATSTARWPKSKLPADTSYRTDAQVRTLADARILAPARAGSAARWPKSKVPSDTVYDGDASLLPTPGSGDAGKVAKVNAGETGYVLAADERGSGGGGAGLPTVSAADNGKVLVVSNGVWAAVDRRVARQVNLGATVTNTSIVDSYSAWSDLAEITIAASETGHLTVKVRAKGVMTGASGGGDRQYGNFRLVRTRGAATTEIGGGEFEFYVRSSGQGGAGFQAATQIALYAEMFNVFNAQQGDVYKGQVQYLAQANARTFTHAPDATNHINIMRT